MKIKIALCDDDTKALPVIAGAAESAFQEKGIHTDIQRFTSGKALLQAMEQTRFQIVLLDIEMPGNTGMEIAEKIRPYLPEVKIIFITSHIEYAIDAFELSIFRYVPKDDREGRLAAAVRDAVKLIGLEAGSVYTIQTSSRLERIPCREIYYIERDGKNAGIISSGGVSRVRKSLQQVYEELDAEEFLYIDRGCIVNLIHVMKVKDSMAVLKNGVSLPISRSHLQEVKKRINDYWGAHI